MTLSVLFTTLYPGPDEWLTQISTQLIFTEQRNELATEWLLFFFKTFGAYLRVLSFYFLENLTS